MRIITWNCKMSYRTKETNIIKYNPDILIIPECEQLGEQTKNRLWFGDNKNKGIGIFSNKDYKIELHPEYNSKFKYIILIKVTGKTNFNLLAVWAMNDSKNVRQRYIGQIYSAINYYNKLLNEPLIIIGDFNWNIIWDKKPTYPLYGNFTDILLILKTKHILSTYHTYFDENFGKETKPTLYMYHQKNKPYHIDYCFASENFILRNVEVGNYDKWTKLSDHVPLIVDFED